MITRMPALSTSLRRNSRPVSGRTRSRLVSAGLVIVAAVMSLVVLAPTAQADRVINGIVVGGKIEEAYSKSGGYWKWGCAHRSRTRLSQAGVATRRSLATCRSTGIPRSTAALHTRSAERSGPAGRRREPSAVHWDSRSPTNTSRVAGGATTSRAASSPGPRPVAPRSCGGGILQKWLARGGAKGYYGVPLGGEYRTGGRFAQDFLNGTVFWPDRRYRVRS